MEDGKELNNSDHFLRKLKLLCMTLWRLILGKPPICISSNFITTFAQFTDKSRESLLRRGSKYGEKATETAEPDNEPRTVAFFLQGVRRRDEDGPGRSCFVVPNQRTIGSFSVHA